MTVTPEGQYSNNVTSDREMVWPKNNKITLPLDFLAELKKARNEEKARQCSSVTNLTPYTLMDFDNPNNRMTIVGNPSLGEVEVLMIGVRNASRTQKSAEIWVDELLLTNFNEQGGVAARASLDLALSDFIKVNDAQDGDYIEFIAQNSGNYSSFDDLLLDANVGFSVNQR